MPKVLVRAALGVSAILILLLPTQSANALSRVAFQSSKLTQIEQTTQSIRQLRQKHPVPAVFAGNSRFDGLLRSELRRDTPDSEIALSQKELTFLGWLKRTQSYRTIVYQGLTAQVIGFYDPHYKRLFVRSNNNQAFGLRRDVIAHEYTHALQDQYYNLSKLLPDQNSIAYRNSDRVSAIHALTEGDAVTTQVLFVSRTYSASEYKSWLQSQQSANTGPSLPKAINRQFYFPYDTGVKFAATLYRIGGFKAIDAAYHRLPQSTYEIMHPSAYLHGWKPVPVSLHHVQGFGGWKQLDDDVMGAFGYQLLIWQYLPEALATKVTDAYRGDRYVFLERGNSDAALFRSQWTSHAAALTAQSALISAIRHRYVRTSVSGTATRTVTTPDGAVAFKVTGTQLSMAYGPSKEVAVALGTARTN